MQQPMLSEFVILSEERSDESKDPYITKKIQARLIRRRHHRSLGKHPHHLTAILRRQR
jgi:hypothetical protein